MLVFFKNKRGFSLIKVLVALTILSLITIPMLSFFAQAYDYTNRNRATTLSLNVAQNAIVYMQKQQFDQIKSILPPTIDDSDESKTLKYTNSGSTEYYYKFSCSENFPSCNEVVNPVINDVPYSIDIGIKAHDQYPDYLIDVIVKVAATTNNKDLFLKGVITNEKIR